MRGWQGVAEGHSVVRVRGAHLRRHLALPRLSLRAAAIPHGVAVRGGARQSLGQLHLPRLATATTLAPLPAPPRLLRTAPRPSTALELAPAARLAPPRRRPRLRPRLHCVQSAREQPLQQRAARRAARPPQLMQRHHAHRQRMLRRAAPPRRARRRVASEPLVAAWRPLRCPPHGEHLRHPVLEDLDVERAPGAPHREDR